MNAHSLQPSWEDLFDDLASAERSLDSRRVVATGSDSAPTGRHLQHEMVAAETAETATGSFRFQGLLGRGGMGEVLRAEQRSLGREVAIKACLGQSASDRQRFRAEAVLTGALRHPSIIVAHDAGDDFLVLRLVRGSTLSQVLGAGLPDDERLAELIEVLVKVADAVAYAHAQGVVHRDIKPANIMLGAHGEVQLMDWGLAARIDASGRLGADAGIGGTPVYCAPEMVGEDPTAVGTWSDVFLLGAVLYRILTGRAPNHAGSVRSILARARRGERTAVEAINPAAPRALVALLSRCFAMAPPDRPSASVVARILRSWLRGRSDRVEAEACSTRAAELEAQAVARPPVAAHGLLAAALAERVRAEGLAPSAATVAARDRCLEQGIDTACAAGDLALAEALSGSPDALGLDPAVAARVAAARADRDAQARARRRLWSGTLVLLVLLALGLAWFTWHGRQADERRRQSDRHEALALLDQAAAVAPGNAAEVLPRHDQRQVLALRALGLADGDAEVGGRVAGLLRAGLEVALAEEAFDLVVARLPLLAELDAAGHARLAADLQQAWERQRIHDRATYRQLDRQVAFLTLPLARDPGFAPGDATAWPLAEILARVAPLLGHPQPQVRALAVAILLQRSEPACLELLPALLDDPEPAITRQAYAAMARCRPLVHGPALLDYLGMDPDGPDIRMRATELHDWYRDPEHLQALAVPGDPTALRRAALAAQIGERHDLAAAWLLALTPATRCLADHRRLAECALAGNVDLATLEGYAEDRGDPLVDAARVRLLTAAGAHRLACAIVQRHGGERLLPATLPMLPDWLASRRALGQTPEEAEIATILERAASGRPAEWGPGLVGLATALEGLVPDLMQRRLRRWAELYAVQVRLELDALAAAGHHLQERALLRWLVRRAPGHPPDLARLTVLDALLETP